MSNQAKHIPPAVWPPAPPAEDDRYGTAWITPDTAAVAGDFGTWTITYLAGPHGIDDGGALRVVFHTISDWGAPQFTDPAAPDYCTVSWTTPDPCHVEARYDAELGIRPWKRVIALRVRDQAIRPGDTISVTLGDRSGGSPGARTQTFAGPVRFYVLLDAYGTGVFVPVGQPVVVNLVAGAPDHLRVHAPSIVAPGEPFDLTVVTRDRWGNRIRSRKQPATLSEPGVHVLTARDDESGLVGESNPVRCAGGEGPYRIFWGDLHAQTEETIGTGTLVDHFAYARDCAALDFVGHQGNDFQITQSLWDDIGRIAQAFNEPGRFLTFPGYEWSGNTPGGGDHNVHFLDEAAEAKGIHRSSHWQIPDRSDEDTDRFPVDRLYDTFRGRDDVLLIPHVGGRYANLREYFDEAVMPLVEIASCWGVFEWFYEDALTRGKVFGFSAGSDDHTARPGMSFCPRGHFATGGGLTAVLAAERTRESIFAALRARRTYATTGARILLDVVANGRYPVGSEFALDGAPLEIAVDLHGTAPLWKVEVLRWPNVVYRYPFPPPDLPAGRHRLRLGWTGARIRARHRMANWSGSLVLGAGRIFGVEGWGFDHPEHGIVAQSKREVRWRSETAGDWDGIVVDLEANAGTSLTFSTGPATFSFTLAGVAERPLEVDAGGVGQRVVIERDPGPRQPRAVRFVYRDAQPPAGRHPYFVRVTQQDGHIAWSSPFFVTA